jgi:hypothetical protein
MQRLLLQKREAVCAYAMDEVAARVRGGRRYGIPFNITEHGFALLNIHPDV